MLSMIPRELAPFHLSWYKHYLLFFSFFSPGNKESEAPTEATDGLGSRSLWKYLEVYTSQTRSQIGSKASLFFEGEEEKRERKNIAHLFLISLQVEVRISTLWVTAWWAPVTEAPNFIRRLSERGAVRFKGRSGMTVREGRYASAGTAADVALPPQLSAVWKQQRCAGVVYLNPQIFNTPPSPSLIVLPLFLLVQVRPESNLMPTN